MLQFTEYSEVQDINIEIECFDIDMETSIDIVSAFISREGIKRLSIDTESPYLSIGPCDICRASNLANHYNTDAILFDGDIERYEICQNCKQAIAGRL